MKRKYLAGLATGLFLMGMAGMANANSMSYNFYNLTNNNVEDLSGQLEVTVWDAAQANSEYGLTLTGTDVLFTFTNNVGTASNISEIYFDDGSLLALYWVYNSLGGFTNFTGGDADPDNLPGGNTATPPFVTTAGFLADVAKGPGGPDKGINTSADILGIAFTLQGSQTWDDVVDELDSGELRVGLHIQSIGAAGGSDSYIDDSSSGHSGGNPVPEPATMLLFGSGLVGLASWARKKR